LRTDKNLDVFTSQIDFGIAVIRKKLNSDPLIFKENIVFKDLKFKDYFYNYKNFMNIKSYDETLKLI